ncbi:MAG: hypothetical protein ACOY16_09230 [Chloroflexota bacterium]
MTLIRLNKQIVAEFDEQTLTLRKRIVGSRHILRQPPAIAFARQIIDYVRSQDCQRIEVVDTERGVVYTASFPTFLEFGIPIERGGFEPQIALPLRYWKVRLPGTANETVVPGAVDVKAKPERPTATQLAFGF